MATLLHQKNYMKSLSNVSGGAEPVNDDNDDDDLLNSSLLGGMTSTADFLDHQVTTTTASSSAACSDLISLGHSSSSFSDHHHHHFSNHSNHHYSQTSSFFSFQSPATTTNLLFNNNSLVTSNTALTTGSTTTPTITGTYSNHLLNNGHHQQHQSHQTNHHPNHHQSHNSSFFNPPHLILNSNCHPHQQPPPPHLIHNQNFYVKNEIVEESANSVTSSTTISTQNGDNSVNSKLQHSRQHLEVDANGIKSEICEEQQQLVEQSTIDSQSLVEEDQEPEPEVDIVINNVVCSFAVRCHLNLKQIALNACNVEFRRENGMVTMKLRKPYTTASIWSSGRITCTGATSEEQSKVAARRYARLLQKMGFRVRFSNFRVVNVLGTCSMPWAIKIVNFSEKYKKDASYEPELHPGVTYKLKEPKATLKIFSTGSITVTANSVAHVQTAIEHIFPLVYEFRKPRPPKAVPIQEVMIPESEEPNNDDDSDLDSDEDAAEVVDNNSGPNRKRFKRSNNKIPNKRRNKRPIGKVENDPFFDIISVSDVEDENMELVATPGIINEQ